jgi:predicted nucleic acid-binding Zn ribbon protein
MFCVNCGRWFQPSRNDNVFCGDRCKAQYSRRTGHDAYIHTDPASFTRRCDHCGVSYRYSEHAKRGGSRAPKYCSDRCRQAAYRGRKTPKGTSQRRKQEGTSQHHKQGGTSQTAWWRNPLIGRKSYSPGARDLALKILDIRYDQSPLAIRAAYKMKIYSLHPDRNDHPEATAQAQAVNWAYNVLK